MPPSRGVIALLNALIAEHGSPQAIRSDNGPEFTSGTLTTWSQDRGITKCRHARLSYSPL